MLNRRARGISPSPTIAFDSRAKALASEGIDVVNLSVGEPDFATPAGARAGGIAAIEGGWTKYTPSGGLHELRQAIAEKLQRDNGLSYSPDEIVVSNGAKQALFNAFMVLLDPGDEVIMQSPYWVTYPEMVKLAGGVPVVLRTDAGTGFLLTPEMIERAVTPRSKVLLLCNPSNPTGVVYSRRRLEDVVTVALQAGLVIIADEIYERLIYGPAQTVSVAALGSEVWERTVTVNGFSKAFAMTGWRLGYTASPRPLAKAMAEVQSHSTSAPSTISQRAGLAALRSDQSCVEEMRRHFDERRRFAMQRLAALPGMQLEVEPEGAFYVFPNVSALFGTTIRGRRIGSSDDLCMALLDLARVAIVPGTGFGSPDHVRISYAASMERLREGFDRMQDFLAECAPTPLRT
jgi:aspartate aminotransferase